ncbi:hypothetical protein [Nocardia sp. NPDC051832]|uniref:hypothetical protein n=1 Tax=Nocardia sp. NPDC051832 TaxID=3155673 RepID=UPI0034333B4F
MDAWALLFGLPCVGLLVLMVLLAKQQARAERERKDALHRFAAHEGWQVSAGSRPPWTSRLPGSNPNGVGLTMTGRVGQRWVTVADYFYETSDSEGSKKRHPLSVVLVHFVDRCHRSR